MSYRSLYQLSRPAYNPRLDVCFADADTLLLPISLIIYISINTIPYLLVI